MKFHNDFIGNDLHSCSLRFFGSDSNERFVDSLVSQADDWYYRSNHITYDINSNGHRCKNIDEIDLSNYILYTGCSNTEGVGLELKKSYPYLVSDILGHDYYNLAVGGTGIDVMVFNLITWFATVKQLPTAVVIQWPDETRFVTIDSTNTHMRPRGTWTTDDPLISRNIIDDETLGRSYTRSFLAKKMLESSIKSPIHYVTVKSQLIPTNILSSVLTSLDQARDLAHYGIKSHSNLSDKLVNMINQKTI